MGILDFLKAPDIHRGLEAYAQEASAVLLDVRTPEEYREGHIPGSCNVPLQRLDDVDEAADGENTALYVYCHSGARAGRAVSMLKQMGYTNVINLGGICDYTGSIER